MHKDNNIENITKLAENLPSESDAFQGSNDFVVYPISGVGGRLNVVQVLEMISMILIIFIVSTIYDITVDALYPT